MTDALRIRHVQTLDKSPLHPELTVRALRHTVWVAVFLSQELHLHYLTDALTRTLIEIDRMLGECIA